MSIDPTNLDGRTEFAPSEFDAMCELVIALAGGAAQAKFDVDTIRDPEGQKPGTLFSDMVKVIELVESMAPDDEAEQDRLRKEGEARATQLVGLEDLWVAIGKLAQALVARQVLSAEEVEFLLQ
jgi:hypothetical protein